MLFFIALYIDRRLHEYIFACMYVYMCVCMLRMYACAYVCMYVCMYLCMYVCMYLLCGGAVGGGLQAPSACTCLLLLLFIYTNTIYLQTYKFQIERNLCLYVRSKRLEQAQVSESQSKISRGAVLYVGVFQALQLSNIHTFPRTNYIHRQHDQDALQSAQRSFLDFNLQHNRRHVRGYSWHRGTCSNGLKYQVWGKRTHVWHHLCCFDHGLVCGAHALLQVFLV
jgi:hypothetical protein